MWLNTWDDHVNFKVESTQHVVLLVRDEWGKLLIPWITKNESGVWNVDRYKEELSYVEVKLLDEDSTLLCEAKIVLSVTNFSGTSQPTE